MPLSRTGASPVGRWLSRHKTLLLGFGLWTSVVGGSFAVNLVLEDQELLDAALTQARIAIKACTLINSARMGFPEHLWGGDLIGVKARIVSLDSDRAEWRPDEWEKQALSTVRAGGEVRELVAGGDRLRVMQRLTVESSCLRCHGRNGRLGETRAGASAEVPLAALRDARRPHLWVAAAGYALFWLLGLAGVAWASRAAAERERERAVREANLHELFDGAPVAYHELDCHGVIQRANRAETALLGYEPEELLGRPIWDFVAAEDREACQRAVTQKLASGQLPVPVQRRYIRRDGREIEVEIHDRVVRGDGGQACGVRSALLDITERVAAERAVRESEATLKAVTHSALNAIVIIDPEGRTRLWNPSAERMFGYSSAEMLGAPIHDFLAPPDVCPGTTDKLSAFRMTGTGSIVGKVTEFRALRKDGREIPVELALAAFQNAGQWYAVGVIQEISERIRAQREISEANEKLSRLVQTLEKKTLQSDLLNELREFLQVCSSIEEIGPVISHSMQKLFPSSGGALFLLSPSKTDLEAAASWGEWSTDIEEQFFSPDACWALRRGRAYAVKDVHEGMICGHLRNQPRTAYSCLPLMAQTSVLGVLHVRTQTGCPGSPESSMVDEIEEIAPTLSEILSMSISNLRLRETLSIQSIKDSLTGLFNRRYMEESVQREIWRASRKQSSIAVIMADIDHFKRFNDLYGHAAGDLVLAQFGSLIKTHSRASDIPCRFGGEEFALILTEATIEDAVRRADDLREQTRALTLSYAGQKIGPVTVSMGVSTYPDHGNTLEDLLRAADTALYQAKQSGRDRVVTAAN